MDTTVFQSLPQKNIFTSVSKELHEKVFFFIPSSIKQYGFLFPYEATPRLNHAPGKIDVLAPPVIGFVNSTYFNKS